MSFPQDLTPALAKVVGIFAALRGSPAEADSRLPRRARSPLFCDFAERSQFRTCSIDFLGLEAICNIFVGNALFPCGRGSVSAFPDLKYLEPEGGPYADGCFGAQKKAGKCLEGLDL